LSFEEDLRRALGDAAPDELPLEAFPGLERLERLLLRWSAKLDLIGFKTEAERICRYFAEPLAASKWLPFEGPALDIGSGGGSPGLPFAIARPGLSWTLLEPRRRRRLFLEEAARELPLQNVVVTGERFGTGSEGCWGELAAISVRGVRLTRGDLDVVGRALSVGGRLLWLSGEDRLREAGEWFQIRGGFSADGPWPLLAGSSARLLVVSRIA
jgi:16S rRNA G527 N7-methylase RsmG